MKTKINLREVKLRRLRLKRLRYRSLVLLLGIIATVVLAFNFWFIDHAEDALEDIVYSQSKGKLKLDIGEFKFNWIKNKIELKNAFIRSTDSSAATSYAVNTKNISIKARGFLPLLFKKQILIDSIRLVSPQVVFARNTARIKPDKTIDTTSTDDESFSVATEMGRITKSITDAINVLQIDKFRLDDGSFSLIDNTKQQEAPFSVSNIYIQLDNLQFDSTVFGKKGKQKIGFTDNIAVRTFNQRIFFPGGRHFMAFKNFRVNLANQRVEFDSCTLRATKGDSTRTAFTIFFNTLQLTNINFDSLYSSETIIADSVFCSKPHIDLDIDSDQKTSTSGKKKVKIQKIDDLLQQLLGDVRLNYVGVKNAKLDVRTIRKGKASTFSSENNNFEVYGLLVRKGLKKPVTLDKFVMTLHNYETVLNDGRYAISFDSIGFQDDIINLNKFSFKEFDKGRTIKSLSMPTFRVRGLSWESLLYDNVFSAESAGFYNPTVDYTTNTGKKKKAKSRNLFEALNSVDDVMDLKNLRIREGNILLRFGKGASLQLTNANLDLKADEFTSANRVNNIQRSIAVLDFDKGVFTKGDLVAHLNKVKLSENKNGIKAGSMVVESDNIQANANDINLGAITLDSNNQSVVMDGVKWSNANIVVNAGSNNKEEEKSSAKKKKKSTPLILKNVNGSNTKLDLTFKQNKITGSFNTIALKELTKNAAGKPEIKGMSLDGKNFLMLAPDTRVSVGEMDINDNNNSVLKNIEVTKINQVDSIIAVIPQLTIIPNITEIVSGNLTLQGLVLTDPFVDAKLGKKGKSTKEKNKKATSISVDSALLERPNIKVSLRNQNDAISYITWDGSKLNSYLKITDLQSTSTTPLKAEQIKMYLTNFEFINAKGKKTATNDNKLNLELNDVLVKKGADDKVTWSTDVNILSLDKLYFDSLGKNNAKLKLDKGDVRNIALNSTYIKNIGDVIANSKDLTINGTDGSFSTSKSDLLWYGFSVNNSIFSVDSFSLTPRQSVEDYRIAKAFNGDYLRLRTGKISAGPVDMQKYNQDSILSMGQIVLNDVDLFNFKDKTQADTSTVVKYKPLPAELLLNLKNNLDIDSLKLNNMKVTYWEINPDTDTLGTISVSDLDVVMANIKNYGIKETDSIYITASAKVLNSLQINLNVTQSYADTSGYTKINLTADSMDLTKFNSLLVPMVGIKVFDGDLHKLQLQTTGNNYASTGTANMFYNNLRVGLLNKKDLPNQTFFNKVVSAIAMAFVIKKSNKGKEALVFFERQQQKSAVNYIIKTTIEGIKTSMGVPGAKKKLRKYKKRMDKK